MSDPMPDDRPAPQTYQIFVKSSAADLWQAITLPEVSRHHLGQVRTTGEPGTPFRVLGPDGESLSDGLIEKWDPPQTLVTSWRALWNADVAQEKASRVSWSIQEREGGSCLLTLVHDRLDDAPRTACAVAGEGWMWILSALKTVVETGRPLTAAP
ncbi:SRPBCC domain-containing protein [Nonomuraea sp. NPDC049684]|uniref:SRPBCC domain-containing protein n=1 Tax=Nonomuraea sp. NPDC049684 TaxID=3364356 RepID=UPI00379879B5